MKKLITLLFAVGLVSAASAQSGDRHRNDSRSNDNSYQSSPYSNQYSGGDQYNRNSQWDGRGDHDRFDRDRQRAERMRYEMMMRRNRSRYHNQGRYDSYSPYGYSRKPAVRLSIGIGGRR